MMMMKAATRLVAPSLARQRPRLEYATCLARRPVWGFVGTSWTTTTPSCQVQQQPQQQRWTTTSTTIRHSSVASRTDDDDHTGPLWDAYYEMLKNSDVHEDEHQTEALEALDRLRQDLMQYKPPVDIISSSSASNSANANSSSSAFGGWFQMASQAATTATTMAKSNAMKKAPRGVYLHGGVGCGKTFTMNLFYDSLATGPWAKERQKIHFHKFMLTVHQEMHMARKQQQQQGKQLESDAILPAVIAKTVQQGRLICLDEFQVTDVADALILQRLFTGLWENGCVVVATSNRPPDDLYLNGLQRDRFLPFIDLLKEKCQILGMWDSQIDYRLIQKMQSGTVPVFFVGKSGRKDMDDLFYELVGTRSVVPTALETQGRKVKIPLASLSGGVARFNFEDLCQKALGAADYLVIGQHFHTVFVENIPILTLNELNWVRRFITFVDSMYESNVKLILHAKTPVKDIFQPETKTEHDEVFAFDRTLSRLDEMASEAYLRKRWSNKAVESKAELLSKQKATLSMTAS